jgi:hypothetical protein
VLDLFGGHSLLTLSLSGQRISERKVPLGSYALWIDPRDDTRLVATPDGLEAFDASGARVWQMRTASTVRAVSFFRDGYLVTLSSGQAVRYVR